ncbi:hypothetical protein [Amycolatopsis sp. NPDC049159]|uniref:hypothetical protein n=1 Tax=Amycolatopsis sp. NPDC049159 TaxID=3157210 RepID=UPI0033FECB50
MTEFLPGEKVVGPSLMHEDRREVSGAYVRPFGMGHPRALMIEQGDGTRSVIDADAARYQNPRMSDSLRNLADVLDNNPKLARWFSFEHFSQHMSAEEAGALDEFADMFGAQVESRTHGPRSSNAGISFSFVSTQIGPIQMQLQAYTEDYEKAKLVAIGPIPPEQIEEAKRVSDWNAEQADRNAGGA